MPDKERKRYEPSSNKQLEPMQTEPSKHLGLSSRLAEPAAWRLNREDITRFDIERHFASEVDDLR